MPRKTVPEFILLQYFLCAILTELSTITMHLIWGNFMDNIPKHFSKSRKIPLTELKAHPLLKQSLAIRMKKSRHLTNP
jgi:hypothetical protein